MSIDATNYQTRMDKFRDQYLGEAGIFRSAENHRKRGNHYEALQRYEQIKGYDPIVLFRIAEMMDLQMKQIPFLETEENLSDRLSYYAQFVADPASYERHFAEVRKASEALASFYRRGIGCQRDTNKAAYYGGLAGALARPDSP